MMKPLLNKELELILSAITVAGGRPLFVGGFVRDLVLGQPSKDVDIEVYELSSETLLEVLEPFGWVEQVGVSFGVLKLRTKDAEYDFALPRRENKEGKGHKGFLVQADPSMTFEDAALRRDFSINAMAMTAEGELLDVYGGKDDLETKQLRHVSPKFSEDPLRVLRAFQFAARFDFTLHPETASLAESLKSEYSSLSKERIWTEWQKWAEQSIKPSRGLDVLRETGWLEFYPELLALINVQQDPTWHPEGDVWTHTKHVTDVAAELALREGLEPKERLILLFAALCHDLGKAVSTVFERGRWRSPDHANTGVPLTKSFLKRIHAPQHIIEQVKPLVKEHMSHMNAISPRAIRRLALRLEPSNIITLSHVIEADASGRPPLKKGLPEGAIKMLELATELDLETEAPQAILLGRHLIQLAKQRDLPETYLKGGPHFSSLLNQVFQAQLDGSISTLEDAQALAMKLAQQTN